MLFFKNPILMPNTTQTKLLPNTMSFQPPNVRQELQNRKILEELQQQKKMLQSKQTTPTTTPTSATSPTIAAHVPIESHVLSSSQRTAIQHAHLNSVGYFITQDSSFGNLILPVIPRVEKS